jgi:hypothetical protein
MSASTSKNNKRARQDDQVASALSAETIETEDEGSDPDSEVDLETVTPRRKEKPSRRQARDARDLP